MNNANTMSLELKILSKPQGSEFDDLSFSFDKKGGTIGRGKLSSWVLPDLEKELSRNHAKIEYLDESYYIVDISSNGIFIDGSTEALGYENRCMLKNGMQLKMGGYVIQVNLVEQAESNSEDESGQDVLPVLTAFDKPELEPGAKLQRESNSEDNFFKDGVFLPEEKEPDPLIPTNELYDGNVINEPIDIPPIVDRNPENERQTSEKPADMKPSSAQGNTEEALEAANFNNLIEGIEPDPEDSAIPSDTDNSFDRLFSGIEDVDNKPLDSVEPIQNSGHESVSVTHNELDPADLTQNEGGEAQAGTGITPPPGEGLPDNGREASEGTTVLKDLPSSIEQQPPEPKSEGASDQPESNRQTPVTDTESGVAAFMQGAGLEHRLTEAPLSEQQMYMVGQILRTAIEGTMDVLRSRANIKGEMRSDVTTIQPLNNNPIKFSYDVDDALEKIFSPNSAAVMPADRALKEAYDDIKAHQISVIAGIQGALKHILGRFEPGKLVDRLEQEQPILAKLPYQREAKLWGKFEQLHEQIQEEAREDFFRLFGHEFTKAYEEQIRQIDMASAPQDPKTTQTI